MYNDLINIVILVYNKKNIDFSVGGFKMSIKLKNEYGEIKIDNSVIAHTAGIAAMKCEGVVGMAAKNVKIGRAHV